jgi:hypothetical protein
VLGVGVEAGVVVTVAVGVDVTVAVGVDVGVAVAVGVTDGVGEAQGTIPMKLPNPSGSVPTLTISITVLLEVSITETLLSASVGT